MIGHGVASRSSYSDAAGRTTSAAKPWTQSRMSRWSSERSRLKGTGSSGVGSWIAGSALMDAKLWRPRTRFCSSGPRPGIETSCPRDKRELEARAGVVQIVAEALTQLAEPVAHGLRVDMDRARDVEDAAVVRQPGAERLQQPLALGRRRIRQRGEPALGQLGDERRVVPEQQRGQVVVGADQPVDLDHARLPEPLHLTGPA